MVEDFYTVVTMTTMFGTMGSIDLARGAIVDDGCGRVGVRVGVGGC